jgi:DNA polymerase-3 subunit alpha
LVATINNYGGFYRTELYILEAKYLGAEINAPCINHSCFETVLKEGKIYLGFHLIKSFEGRTAKLIYDERGLNGPFESFDDFIERVPISQEHLNLLIRMNAFRSVGKSKRALLWEAKLKVNNQKVEDFKANLFRVVPKNYELPKLENSWQEDFFDQLELLDFPLYSPFEIVSESIEAPIVLAKDLINCHNKKVVIKGYLIHVKRTATSNGKQMFFGTFLDENGDWLDSVHFPPIAIKYPFQGRGVYLIYGKVTVEYDCVIVETIKMKKMDVIEGPRYSVQIDRTAETVTWNNRKTYQKDWVGEKPNNVPPSIHSG